MASIGSRLTDAAWGVKSSFDNIEKRVFSDTKAAKKIIGIATNFFDLLEKNPEFVKSLKTVKPFIKIHDLYSGVSGIIGKVFGEPTTIRSRETVEVSNNNNAPQPPIDQEMQQKIDNSTTEISNNNNASQPPINQEMQQKIDNSTTQKNKFEKVKEVLSNGWQVSTGYLIPVLWAVADFADVKKAAQEWGFINYATKQAKVASNIGKASVFGKIAKADFEDVVKGVVIFALALSIVNDTATIIKTAVKAYQPRSAVGYMPDSSRSKIVNGAKYYWYRSERLRQKLDAKAFTSLTINAIELTSICLPFLGVVNQAPKLLLGLASNTLGLFKVFVFDAK